MNKFTAKPIVALELIGESTKYHLEIGTAIESMTIARPYKDEVISGTIVAIGLAARPGSASGRIFDGIATAQYGTDDIAGIMNASDYFVGDKIALADENGKIIVVNVDRIKGIDGAITYPNGDVISVVDSAEALTAAVVIGGDVLIVEDVDAPTAIKVVVDTKLNLNGKNITISEDTEGEGVFKITDGTLTIEGDGVINGVGKNSWNMALWATENGKVVINGGTFTNEGATADNDPSHFDLIYASGNAQIEINGGIFKGQTPAWLLNIKDKDRATAKIVVKGGTFYGFNPSNNAAEGPNTNFVAEGYKVVEETTGVFVVMPADEAETVAPAAQ